MLLNVLVDFGAVSFTEIAFDLATFARMTVGMFVIRRFAIDRMA